MKFVEIQSGSSPTIVQDISNQTAQPDLHYLSNSDGEDNSRCSFGSVPGDPGGVLSSNVVTEVEQTPAHQCDLCGSE